MASRSALLRLDDDDVPFGPSLARDCASSHEPVAIRIDDTYVVYDELPEVPVQRPGPPLRHEPPLPGEEDGA